MAGTRKRTFDLPAEHGAFIDEKVASGAYASESEVVGAGLRALRDRDAAVERWLHADVGPTYDRMKANPGGGITPEQMADRMRERHEVHPKATA